MRYRKITVELIVETSETEGVVNQLNSALDQLDERYIIFGGDIETVDFNHSGKQRRSALAHTLAAGETVAGVLRNTGKHIGNAARTVI